MRKILLPFFILLFTQLAFGQKDSISVRSYAVLKSTGAQAQENSVNIFPVPVRDGQMTITSTKEIFSVKITNIIGQDVYKSAPGESSTQIKVSLDNPRRGVYIVSVVFTDRTRSIKKIMVEGTDSY